MSKNVKYIPCHGSSDINCIKVEVGYEHGGMNCFGGTNQRGYYLYVTPIRRGREIYGYSEAYELLGTNSGKKMLLKSVNRKSAKAEAETYKLAEQAENELVNVVCMNAGLVLGEVA